MSWRRRAFAFAPLAGLLTAAQAPAPLVGIAPAGIATIGIAASSVMHGVLGVEGKQVPLPTGDWVRAGTAESGDVVSVALLRVERGKAVGAVLVQASRAGRAPGWGAAPACSRTDLPFVRSRYASDHDGSCAWVARVAGEDEAADPAWAAARRLAAARGWAMPAAWAVSAIRVSAPISAVQVRYAVPSGPDGPDPAALGDWTQGTWEQVERGLHNRLDPLRPLTMPGVKGKPPEHPVAGPDSGFHLSRAVWKTISFRVLGTTLDFTTNYIAVGDLATAATLSALPIVIGPWIYLGHELAWEHFGGPAEPHRDLPGLGTEKPWPEKGS